MYLLTCGTVSDKNLSCSVCS